MTSLVAARLREGDGSQTALLCLLPYFDHIPSTIIHSRSLILHFLAGASSQASMRRSTLEPRTSPGPNGSFHESPLRPPAPCPHAATQHLRLPLLSPLQRRLSHRSLSVGESRACAGCRVSGRGRGDQGGRRVGDRVDVKVGCVMIS